MCNFFLAIRLIGKVATYCCYLGLPLSGPRGQAWPACARTVSEGRKRLTIACCINFLRTTRGNYKYSAAIVVVHWGDRETGHRFAAAMVIRSLAGCEGDARNASYSWGQLSGACYFGKMAYALNANPKPQRQLGFCACAVPTALVPAILKLS